MTREVGQQEGSWLVARRGNDEILRQAQDETCIAGAR
jgi:hypothetical protein